MNGLVWFGLQCLIYVVVPLTLLLHNTFNSLPTEGSSKIFQLVAHDWSYNLLFFLLVLVLALLLFVTQFTFLHFD